MYHRKRTLVKIDYHLNVIRLERVKKIRDFDGWNTELCKSYQFTHIEGLLPLAFVKRICTDFRNPYTLKIGYCFLYYSLINFRIWFSFMEFKIHKCLYYYIYALGRLNWNTYVLCHHMKVADIQPILKLKRWQSEEIIMQY